MLKQNEKILAVLDRFEEETAVLKFPDNQILKMPLAILPEGAGEGSVLEVSFAQEGKETEKRLNQAKTLLNEILKKD